MEPDDVEIVPVRNTAELWVCAKLLVEASSHFDESRVTYATAYGRLKCAYHTPGFKGWMVMLDARPIGGCIGNLRSDKGYFQLKELFLTQEWISSPLGPFLLEKVRESLSEIGVITLSLYSFDDGN